MTELTVTLPDELARKAQEAGLLNSAGVERALRETLKREAGRKLLEIADRLQAANIPPMTEEELNSEIKSVREEMRNERARRP
jgi:hypothetical protein